MAFVEWWWFDHIFTGERLTGADLGGAMTGTRTSTTSTPARAMADIEHVPAPVRRVARTWWRPTASTPSRRRPRGPVSLRWIMIHMIEEYARHNGHADLLREQIDGAVGE